MFTKLKQWLFPSQHSSLAPDEDRAASWDLFIGNEEAKEQLQVAISAALISNQRLPNIMLYGPAGSGKTTLAKLVGKSYQAGFLEITGSTLKSQEHVLRLLYLAMQELRKYRRVIVFIDEIHGISKGSLPVDSWLPLLERNEFFHSCHGKYLKINDKVVRVVLSPVVVPEITWIGATTDPGILHAAVRRRFPITVSLTKYTIDDIAQIITTYCKNASILIDREAVRFLAERSRNSPAIAIHHLLRLARDLAVLSNSEKITLVHATRAANLSKIGPFGLRSEDIAVLKTLYYAYPGGCGLKSISDSTNLPLNILQEMVLPFLQSEQWVKTTHKRFLTEKGKKFMEQLGLQEGTL